MCVFKRRSTIHLLNQVKLSNKVLHQPTTDLEIAPFTISEQRLSQVCMTLMSPSCIIDSLRICDNNLSLENMEVLGEAISINSSITAIKLVDCRFTKNQFNLLCTAFKRRSKGHLSIIELKRFKMTDQNIEELKALLDHEKELNELIVDDCMASDKDLLTIFEGISTESLLQKISLKRNNFGTIGLTAVIEAIERADSIKCLEIDGLLLDETNSKLLVKMLDSPQVDMTHLTMNDADFTEEIFQEMMQSLLSQKNLKYLTLQKYDLNLHMCMQLYNILCSHQSLKSLDLSFTRLNCQGLMFLCTGIENSSLIESLNLSYCNFEAEGLVFLCRVLQRNKTLISLNLQGINLGQAQVQQLVTATVQHPTLSILDISNNQIEQDGLVSVLEMFCKKRPIKSLKAQSNKISTSGRMSKSIDSLINNLNIEILDLQNNDICNDFGLKLLDMVKDSYIPEEVNLKGNKMINYNYIESIEDECRKNHLIKHLIMPQLTGHHKNSKCNLGIEFTKRKVTQLYLSNETYYQSDFIGKFIRLNQSSLRVIHFKNIVFHNGMADCMQQSSVKNLRVMKLVFESCRLGTTTIHEVMQFIKQLSELEELHLIDMELNKHGPIERYLAFNSNLQVLDLRNNKIQNFEDIVPVMEAHGCLEWIDLRGNDITKYRQVQNLMSGLQKSISIVRIKYNLLLSDQTLITKWNSELQDELNKNRAIRQLLKLKKISKTLLTSSCILDLSNTFILGDHLDAIFKFQKVLKNKTELNLTSCQLNDSHIANLVLYILTDLNNAVDTFILEDNILTDVSCVQIANLISAKHLDIKRLDLSYNKQITCTGLIELLESSKADVHLNYLSLNGCGISRPTPIQRLEIIKLISQNISLVDLSLVNNDISDDKELIEIIRQQLVINKQIKEQILDKKQWKLPPKDKLELVRQIQNEVLEEINSDVSKSHSRVTRKSVLRSAFANSRLRQSSFQTIQQLNFGEVMDQNESSDSSAEGPISQSGKEDPATSDKFTTETEEQSPGEDIINLSGRNMTNVKFLKKYLFNQNREIPHLDLSNNNLGAIELDLCDLISQPFFKVQRLDISKNKLYSSGLHKVCSALLENMHIKELNIQDNEINDSELKIIYPFLQINKSLRSIEYSLTNPTNIEKVQIFNAHSHLSKHELRQHLNSQFEHHTDWKVKLCLPLWCWRSFIHDKHEAFRFKYDTKKLQELEQYMIKKHYVKILYLNSLIYYFIMFGCPFLFRDECSVGVQLTTHFIYGSYSIFTIILEIMMVYNIQRKLGDKNLLRFNKWHFVELFMGQIARFDTYLDVCFMSMISACDEWPLFSAVATFVGIYLTFPFIQLFRLRQIKETQFTHTLPTIERCCKLSYIRENMLLATVLDSFCITNNIYLCKNMKLTMGRGMGIWTFLTQDGPQYLIHLLFIFCLESKISHNDETVIMSLVVSSFAIMITAFNIIMCVPNEFDPIIVEFELKKRKETDAIMNKAKKWFEEKISKFMIKPTPSIRRGSSRLDISPQKVHSHHERNGNSPSMPIQISMDRVGIQIQNLYHDCDDQQESENLEDDSLEPMNNEQQSQIQSQQIERRSNQLPQIVPREQTPTKLFLPDPNKVEAKRQRKRRVSFQIPGISAMHFPNFNETVSSNNSIQESNN